MDEHQEINQICTDMSPTLEHVNQTNCNVVELPIEPTNATGTNMEYLNEDCLLQIFSSNSLTLMDLCSLAETCKLFQRITQRVCPKDIEIVTSNYGSESYHYKFESNNYSVSSKAVQDVERILKNFGPCVITFDVCSNDLDIMNLVAKYYGDGTLKKLCLDLIDWNGDLQVKFESIFERLQVLTIIKLAGQNEDTAALQLNCDSLMELNVFGDGVYVSDAILKNTFPKLERFTFHPTNYDLGRNALPLFVERHKCLTSIDFGFYCSGITIAHTIANSCQELKELSLCIDNDISITFTLRGKWRVITRH